jgi:hypothetical protein
MASITDLPSATPACGVCAGIPWLELLPEDADGVLHHKSRKSLETSAEHCTLCAMVLRAATSNYRDSRGIRHGKGYWRNIEHMKCSEGQSIRDVKVVRDLGSHAPTLQVEVDAHSPPMVCSATACLQDDFTKTIDASVIAPTRKADDSYTTLPCEDPLDLSDLEIRSATENLPVWLYGNFWATPEPKQPGDSSLIRLVGIGARFGTSASPFDAYGSQPGEMHLRGSSIGLCSVTGTCN